MNYWILPSNQNVFDIKSCLAEKHFVYWKQRNRFEVNDIVFIYCAGGDGKICFVTIVEETGLAYDEAVMGLDRKYWKVPFDESGERTKLRLLQEVESDALSLGELRKHGLLGSIQGARTISGELLEYLKSNFKDVLHQPINEPQEKNMKSTEPIFKHRIDKSFLKYGFVISRKEESENSEYLKYATDNKKTIKVTFEGEDYQAYFDYPSSSKRYRMMFKADFKSAIQKKFENCYSISNDDIKAKQEVVVNIGFFSTDDKYAFEAKQIGSTVIVDPQQMQNQYEAYLNGLNGAFSGYPAAINRRFVIDKVKELFDLTSAYYLTDPDEVTQLVNAIRKDPNTKQQDIQSSHRSSSCSLAKYAEFLEQYNKKQNTKPFKLDAVNDAIKASGLIFDTKFVERYVCSLLTKPFVILSGLTGSGKTRLAMAFPKLICEDKSQYKLIPVGADWANREQLLGYPNALRPGEYIMPDNGALQLILEASKPENQNKPYFLVLDEMNMSYVERYFADFLSAMESGEEIPLWEGNNEVPATITLPKNLFIIGTINVDETTYMFSPKVLDRANVIEFRINKEQMLEYLNGTGEIAKIENHAELAADFVAAASKDFAGSLSDEMKTTLISMFDTLSKIQKEFGYRTAHEMSRFIAISKSYTAMGDEEAIDAAMVQKLLPKIHGSRKKISPVLTALWQLCYKAKPVEIDTLDAMPSLDTFNYPLTAEKIWRMYQIAQDNGFTSFAEA